MRKSAILILTGWTLAIVLACSSLSRPPQNPALPTTPSAGAGGDNGIAKALAPNNELLAYMVFSNKRNDIHLIDPSTHGSDVCVSCQSPVGLITSAHPWIAWSPDHTKIAYLATHEEAGKFPADLYITDLHGSAKLLKTWDIIDEPGKSVLYIEPLAWSPDGRRVLVMFGSGTSVSGLHIVEIATGDEQHVQGSGMSPVWLDNQTIALIANQDGRIEIYTMKLADPTLRLKTQFKFELQRPFSEPIWSPDHDSLFVVDSQGIDSVVSTSGATIFELKSTIPVSVDATAWSPDGRHLVVMGTVDIYVVDLQTGSMMQLSHSPDEIESEPSWSPTGSRIAFGRFSKGIYTVNLDGTGEQVVVASQDASYPTWR